MVSVDPFVWVSAIVILFLWSFLIKVNPLYEFAENIFVAISLGNSFVLSVGVIISSSLIPIMQGDILGIIPLLLGITLLTRLVPKYSWISTYGTAFFVGTGNGLILRAILQTDVLAQIRSTLFSLSGDPMDVFNGIISALAVVTVLYYFVFTMPKLYERKGSNIIIRIGKWFILLGIAFYLGSDISARVPAAFDALNIILIDWLGLYFG